MSPQHLTSTATTPLVPVVEEPLQPPQVPDVFSTGAGALDLSFSTYPQRVRRFMAVMDGAWM